MASVGMVSAVPELRRVGETEKLTINLGVVDLGQIDLLVQEGFYSNRTDLIRTAIRNQLAVHGDEVKRTVARRTLVLGLQNFTRADLERAQAAGQRLQIQVVGLARIADDVSRGARARHHRIRRSLGCVPRQCRGTSRTRGSHTLKSLFFLESRI